MVENDLSAVPPRYVTPLTRVEGHVIVREARPVFCSCGWRAEDGSGDAADRHLAEAWPIFVPRVDSEPLEVWRARVEAVHSSAIEEREAAWSANRMGEGVRPGGPIPEVPRDWAVADARVEILEHQLEDLRERGVGFV